MLFFAILGFGKYQPLKSANIHKNQNSEPLTVLKWQILDSKSTQLWFHVKSERQKNSIIYTLCFIFLCYVKFLHFCCTCYEHSKNVRSVAGHRIYLRLFIHLSKSEILKFYVKSWLILCTSFQLQPSTHSFSWPSITYLSHPVTFSWKAMSKRPRIPSIFLILIYQPWRQCNFPQFQRTKIRENLTSGLKWPILLITNHSSPALFLWRSFRY